MKTLSSILLCAAVACAFITVRTQAADAPKTVQVNIYNYKFDPEALTVPVGTTVTWTNKDEVPHTVTSSDKAFTSSGGLDTGDSYSYTFTKAGTFEYYCTLHPFMKAKVVVTPVVPAGE